MNLIILTDTMPSVPRHTSHPLITLFTELFLNILIIKYNYYCFKFINYFLFLRYITICIIYSKIVLFLLHETLLIFNNSQSR